MEKSDATSVNGDKEAGDGEENMNMSEKEDWTIALPIPIILETEENCNPGGVKTSSEKTSTELLGENQGLQQHLISIDNELATLQHNLSLSQDENSLIKSEIEDTQKVGRDQVNKLEAYLQNCKEGNRDLQEKVDKLKSCVTDVSKTMFATVIQLNSKMPVDPEKTSSMLMPPPPPPPPKPITSKAMLPVSTSKALVPVSTSKALVPESTYAAMARSAKPPPGASKALLDFLEWNKNAPMLTGLSEPAPTSSSSALVPFSKGQVHTAAASATGRRQLKQTRNEGPTDGGTQKSRQIHGIALSNAIDQDHRCLCGQSFSRRDMLKEHLRVMAQNHYRCSTCGQIFSEAKVLKTHKERYHSNVRTIRRTCCEFCGMKGFKTESELNYHLMHEHNKRKSELKNTRSAAKKYHVAP